MDQIHRHDARFAAAKDAMVHFEAISSHIRGLREEHDGDAIRVSTAFQGLEGADEGRIERRRIFF